MSNFEEAYELTGHGLFNHLALLTNGFILLHVAVQCVGLGYVLNKADCDLNIGEAERGAISAATFFGVVTPAMFWGYLADTFGRRAVMLPATVLAVICSLMSSMATNFMAMFLLRLITGGLISASCATTYVYLGELTSPSYRATVIAWGSAFIAGGYFMMPVSAWILLPYNYRIHVTGRLYIVSWRVLMWAFGIWGVAGCIGMAILPESPGFLLSTKGGTAALPVLAKIYSWNTKKPADEFPVKDLLHSPGHPRLTIKESLIQMKHLCKPPLLRCIVLSHVCNFMVFLQSNTFYVWMPHIIDELLQCIDTHPEYAMCKTMNELHLDTKIGLAECLPVYVDHRVYPLAMAFGVLTGFLYVAIGMVLKRLGKQKVFCTIMSICGTLLLVSAVVPSVVAAIALLIPGLCGIVSNTVLGVAVIEVIPVNLRAQAMCTLFMVGRLGAAVGINAMGWAFDHNHCMPAVTVITVVTAASGFLLYLWPDSAKVRAEMEAKNFVY